MSSEISFYIVSYGYLAIFILVFMQEVGIPNPIPNELVLMFSGYLIYKGGLHFTNVIAVVVCADFVATNILYFVFYFFGGYILSHKPKWFPVSDKTIDRLSAKFSGGNSNIFLGRLTPFLRGYTAVITGILQIKPTVFLPIALISALTWSLFYVSAGMIVAPYWSQFTSNPENMKYAMIIILLVILTIILIRFLLSRRRKNSSNANAADGLQAITNSNQNNNSERMKIHIVSETAYTAKGAGVHTAFVDMIEMLREGNDVDVVVNSEGSGDLYHSHSYGPYYFWKGRKYKGKRVFTAHVIPDSCKGTIPKWRFWYPFVKWYLREVYSYADVCIAISPMVREAIKNLRAKTHIVNIYNPIPVGRWKRTNKMRAKGREMLGLAPNDFAVLGVGQLQARKGVEDFIDIAERIPEAKFVWTGGRPMGILTEGIQRINHRMAKVSKHIQFTGMLELEQMPYIYAACDVFLFPSYQENCPMAPIEAAASGMPVVFRDIKEYTLLYEKPYIKACSTEDFILLTKKLMTDESFYREACEISGALITQFDKDEIRKKLILLYSNLLYNTQPSYTIINNPSIVPGH